MNHKVWISALLLACMLGGAGAAHADEQAVKPKKAVDQEPVVTLHTTQGDIVLRFFEDKAPEHVKNFLTHSKREYFNGSAFHRVIPGFMIQGGDPNTKPNATGRPGTGGYSYKGPGTMLEAEFNDTKHVRGILSMARGGDPNSAGSQFFIMHRNSPHLDGKYTAFGEVIDGIEVVDLIASAKRDKRDKPIEDQRILEAKLSYWASAKVEETKAAMLEETPGSK